VNLIQAHIWNCRNHSIAWQPKKHKVSKPRLKVGKAIDGAELLVVAMKAGNAAGAKG
jgi:hypothetical protein